MAVCYPGTPPLVRTNLLGGTREEGAQRMNQVKLLSMIVTDRLKWQGHTDHVCVGGGHPRLCTCSGCYEGLVSVLLKDTVSIHTALVRPIMEYSCQVWHTGLTVHRREPPEQMQRGALRVAYPDLSYSVVLLTTWLDTLHDRREILCRLLFVNIRNLSHKLHPLLPIPRQRRYNVWNPSACCRAASVLPLWNSRCKIELIFGVMLQFNVVWCIHSRREIVLAIQSDNGKQGYKVGRKKYRRPKVVLSQRPLRTVLQRLDLETQRILSSQHDPSVPRDWSQKVLWHSDTVHLCCLHRGGFRGCSIVFGETVKSSVQMNVIKLTEP